MTRAILIAAAVFAFMASASAATEWHRAICAKMYERFDGRLHIDVRTDDGNHYGFGCRPSDQQEGVGQ